MAIPPPQSVDDLFDRHRGLMRLVARPPPPASAQQQAGTTDIEILAKHYRFVMPSESEEGHPSTWEARMAKRYYDKLFKEYALADLSRYCEGKVGLRWRTEREVIEGKGQFTCGNKRCSHKGGLCSYELNFKYAEDGTVKNELVKVRVCEACADLLFYTKSKDHRDAARSQRVPQSVQAGSSSREKRKSGEGGHEEEEDERGASQRRDERQAEKRHKAVDDRDRPQKPLFPTAPLPAAAEPASSGKSKKEKPTGDGGKGETGEEGDDGLKATTSLTEEEADAFIRELLL